MSKKNKTKKRKYNFLKILFFLLSTIVIYIFGAMVFYILNNMQQHGIENLKNVIVPDWIDVQLINIDGVSRRGEDLTDIRDIVIHYIGNPGTTAQQNHDYYTNYDSEVSSHFIIGLDGEIIQCIPLYEKSSASNWRNNDTISIEVCHPDETGKFTEASYNSLVKLTAWLYNICNLNENNIIRHYDVTQKRCPLYFVEHEDAWYQFKYDVKDIH